MPDDRRLGIDLQQRIHEDMRAHFSLYPALWGVTVAKLATYPKPRDLASYSDAKGQSVIGNGERGNSE